MDRAKGRLGRAAAVFLPVWLVLLYLLPFSGMGPLPCMSIATFLALGLVIWRDRRRERRLAAEAATPDGAGAARPAAAKGPMSPLAAAAYTLGGVVVFAYVIFIVVTAAQGR